MSSQAPKLDDLRIHRSDRPNTRSYGWVWIVLILLLAAGGAAWWFLRPKAVAVRAAPARELATGPGAERTVLNASGYVTARREATVSSKITGKVVEVMIEEGQRVKAGEVLAKLDDTNVMGNLFLARAQREAAEASIAETRVRLGESERELERQSALKKGNVAAIADYDHAEAAAHALRARVLQQEQELKVSERQIAIWEQQVEDTVIRAPFGGIVTSKNAQPGEMISPMSAGGFTRTGICTIVDMESLEIEIDVNESYINRVSPGQPVEATLDAYPDWKIGCKVIAIIPTADRQKSTVKVRVGFNELDPRILPDMAVKVAFREASTAGAVAATREIAIPKNAVRNEDGRDVVFVIAGDHVERRAITVSSTQGDQTFVRAGVASGERVIIEADGPLSEGTRVTEKSL